MYATVEPELRKKRLLAWAEALEDKSRWPALELLEMSSESSTDLFKNTPGFEKVVAAGKTRGEKFVVRSASHYAFNVLPDKEFKGVRPLLWLVDLN